MFDSLIHLQDSQTCRSETRCCFMFDSLIHLQDSQTWWGCSHRKIRLIHLFTYKTLKQERVTSTLRFCLIHLFTYKTLKRPGGHQQNQ